MPKLPSLCFLLIACCLSEPALAQRRSSARRTDTRGSSTPRGQSRTNNTKPRQSRGTAVTQQPMAADFLEPCYKLGANVDFSDEFRASGFQWPQPGGDGSSITITYSYSNLLDGSIDGLTVQEIRQATEEALTLWAAVAPLNFVEVVDSGPEPGDTEYPAGNHPQIRIGAVEIDGADGDTLAQAYLPYSDTQGLAGDLQFDKDESWSRNNGGYFLETMTHELGHSLGLEHEEDVDAIMNPFIAERYAGLGDGFLLEDDIEGIREIYGEGIGSVTPLEQNEEPDEPEPPANPDDDNDLVAEINDATGAITITGDAANNEVMLFRVFSYTLVIGMGETLVNGGEGDFFRAGDVEVALGSGDDQFTTWGFSSNLTQVSLGDGDDLATFIFSQFSQLRVEGGSGNDSVRRIFSWAREYVSADIETGGSP